MMDRVRMRTLLFRVGIAAICVGVVIVGARSVATLSGARWIGWTAWARDGAFALGAVLLAGPLASLGQRRGLRSFRLAARLALLGVVVAIIHSAFALVPLDDPLREILRIRESGLAMAYARLGLALSTCATLAWGCLSRTHTLPARSSASVGAVLLVWTVCLAAVIYTLTISQSLMDNPFDRAKLEAVMGFERWTSVCSLIAVLLTIPTCAALIRVSGVWLGAGVAPSTEHKSPR